jgi:hypothetical protein
MKRTIIALLLFSALPVFGLNNRSAVSVAGLDTNPCTVASPCRSFNIAIAATVAGGEVIALDSAGYGPFTVPMPLSISGAPGAHAALTVTSGAGVTVAAGATDKVVVRNLVLIGAGGTVGIEDSTSKEVAVIGCLIRGFASSGVQIETTAGNASVEDCTIMENSAAGINQVAGGSNHRVVVSRSLVHYNNVGIHAQQAGVFDITDTAVSSNSTAGIEVDASTGNAFLTAKRCSIVSNAGPGVLTLIGGQNLATTYLSQNVIAFNFTVGVANNGTTYTFNNNRIAFNTTGDVSGVALVSAALQ